MVAGGRDMTVRDGMISQYTVKGLECNLRECVDEDGGVMTFESGKTRKYSDAASILTFFASILEAPFTGNCTSSFPITSSPLALPSSLQLHPHHLVYP